MKNIFRKKITYLTICGVLFTAGACNEDKFLDVPVTGQVSESQLLTEDGLNGLLISVYAALNGDTNLGWFSGQANWLWGSIRGGDANKGSDAGDFNTITPYARFEQTPTDPLAPNKWRGSYEGISRANIFLKNLALSEDLSDEQKTALEAEGRFLRGLYYFELRRTFLNVPWIDETMTDAEAALVTNTAEIWPNIESEFQFAMDNLPETQDEVGRVNKWAAAAFLARTYMYQDKFSEAKTLYDNIIANGQTSNGLKYGLVENFEDVFKGPNENHQESVFAFQAAANTGDINNTNHEIAMNYPYNTGPSGPGECCGFFQPSFELVNSYRTNSAGLPLLDGSYNSAANAVKDDYGLLSSQPFTPDQGPLDPRLDHSIGRRDIMFLDWQKHPGDAWIRDQSFAGPYTQKKYSYYQADKGTYQDGSSWTPGYHSINFMIMRYADVLLMAAEAEIEVGSLEKAREYVNMVRERAGNSVVLDPDTEAPAANYVIGTYDSPWASKEEARRAVRFERKLELSLEGQRFYDLVRWGIADSVVNAYLDYEGGRLQTNLGGATFTANQDEYLPIPQSQIDLQQAEGSDGSSSVLVQNPGYN
ncbi:RagB/SusD family nutrient uptake outer membrane protein [Porifericola rhodea]|uniref:RagB/SusD family nutrient uptake outer membrane protein n=1 Tax=Porifericola rhodea TaxID=930972 RepID=UPI00266517B0|nr:RagB/SusD family nutrient uptake outer membrane protein [Porifericola rhodea]WKN33366.1 RagB/SusD family nutrient uptake outer membrane protein [Porifericola rhodea]